ncbi:MAG: hypothetical protein QY317_08605 [Candidatus Jettenia caeni]|nr:MAG: hypothetical protein QY317_08605 [Candidatus Jettenia caeni]
MITTIPYFQYLLVKPYVRFSLIRLSCSLLNKALSTVGEVPALSLPEIPHVLLSLCPSPLLPVPG